jgi:predicted dehydrogenase
MNKKQLSRRNFMKTATAGAAAVGAASTAFGAAHPRVLGANERIRIGIIGPGGRAAGYQDQMLEGHMRHLCGSSKEGKALRRKFDIEITAVCDVWDYRTERAAALAEKESARALEEAVSPKDTKDSKDPLKGGAFKATQHHRDYRKLLDDKNVDVVLIATPDHWHAKQTIDAAAAGKDVYCEKPMTHTIDEARQVCDAIQKYNRVMQVGVQSMSDPRWRAANEYVKDGKIGHVLQAHTSYYRNSAVGQWRYYKLTEDMTPRSIDWKMFLGTDFGLAPDQPFDRAIFQQWRCYWDFGGGMYTDLFVHQLTHLITAVGVRFPRRVVGAGGLYMEYDGRDVPDVATVLADYDEGCQVIITATMCNDYPIEEVIRGHTGTIKFLAGRDDGFKLMPNFPKNNPGKPGYPGEEPKDTEHVKTGSPPPGTDETVLHWMNFLECVQSRKHETNNTPELGYAAIATVNLGTQSYREGKAYFWDSKNHRATLADTSWAQAWEKRSKSRSKPNQVAGWRAGDNGSLLEPPDYQKLAGPWIDGKDPAAVSGG